MRRLKRFALPLVLSTALHLGAGVGIGKLIERLKPPPVAEKVLHENIQKPQEPKKKPDLEKLKEERRLYVAELHESLMKGEEIKLSDFLIKSAVLDKNIELAEKEEFGPSEEFIKYEYSEIVKEAEKDVESEKNKIGALHFFVHTQIFKGYFWESDGMDDVVDRGWYNCLSSTELFSALLEDVLGNKDYQLLLFDDHVATFLNGRKIENTEHEWKNTNTKYNRCGLRVHRDAFIGAYLVKNGITPEELPTHVSAAYSSKKRWKGCPKKGKKIVENRMGTSGFPSPGVKSGLSVPSYFIPNPYYDTKVEDIVKIAKGLRAAYKLAYIDDEKEFVEVEVNGYKIKINPIPVPEDTDWGELLEKFKFYFSLSSLLPLLPEEEQCCFPMLAIPPMTIVNIIEGLSEMKYTKFEQHTRENICRRYKNAIEFGTAQELDEYTAYNFCKELNDSLKERYDDKERWQILRFGLADMRLPENFDLFLKELESDDEVIKQDAAVGMILSDKERGCSVLKELPKEEKEILHFQLIWGCKDIDMTWKYITDWLAGKKEAEGILHNTLYTSLGVIKGAEITDEQYEFLKKNIDRFPSESKFEIARIAYKREDKEFAIKSVEKTVEKILNNDEHDKIGSCCLPKEFVPLMTPLLEDPNFRISVARQVLCSGAEYKKYIPELTEALRDTVYDIDMPEYTRIIAAYFLLKAGVDPLEE